MSYISKSPGSILWEWNGTDLNQIGPFTYIGTNPITGSVTMSLTNSGGQNRVKFAYSSFRQRGHWEFLGVNEPLPRRFVVEYILHSGDPALFDGMGVFARSSDDTAMLGVLHLRSTTGQFYQITSGSAVGVFITGEPSWSGNTTGFYCRYTYELPTNSSLATGNYLFCRTDSVILGGAAQSPGTALTTVNSSINGKTFTKIGFGVGNAVASTTDSFMFSSIRILKA